MSTGNKSSNNRRQPDPFQQDPLQRDPLQPDPLHLGGFLLEEYTRRQPELVRVIRGWLKAGRSPEDIGRIGRSVGASQHVEDVMVLIARELEKRGQEPAART